MPRKLILTGMVLVALLSCNFVVFVEADSSVGWSRTYGKRGDNWVHSMVATSDGGYAIAGNSLLVKTDEFGNMVWNQTYSTSIGSFVKTSDGGYAMVSGSRLITTDAYGNIELNKTCGELRVYALVLTVDGGYVMATDSLLVKTDECGDIVWNQTSERSFHSLVATSDGGCLLATGGTELGENENEIDVWLVKIHRDGEIEWTQKYGRQYKDRVSAVVETSDGGYVIAGDSGSASGLPPTENSSKYGYWSDSDLWLFKVDKFGNKTWEKTYGDEVKDDYANALIETSDGGYAIVGSILGYCWLIKTDATGNMQWNRKYDGGSFSSLVQTSDGGYVIAGNTDKRYTEEFEMWLMKTDEHGIGPDMLLEPWDTTAIIIALAVVTILPVVAVFVHHKRKTGKVKQPTLHANS